MAHHNPHDIRARLAAFAVAVIKLSAALPHSQSGQYLVEQLLHSGTAPVATYAELLSVEEEAAVLIESLKSILRELNKVLVWLDIARQTGMLPANSVTYISAECSDLCQIIDSDLKTALAEKAKNS